MASIDPSRPLDKGCVLIVEAGHLLSCNDVTICKGLLIYHHYQSVKNENESFFYLIATASLSLSIQICEEKIKTEDVLKVFKSLGAQTKESISKEELNVLLRNLQYDIYRVVFDRPYREAATKVVRDELVCETAHKYVLLYLKRLKSIPEVKKELISVQTWTSRLLLTFYHCQKCILYDALEIALAALGMAFTSFQIDAKHLKTVIKDISTSVNELKVNLAKQDIVMVSDIGTEHINYRLMKISLK